MIYTDLDRKRYRVNQLRKLLATAARQLADTLDSEPNSSYEDFALDQCKQVFQAFESARTKMQFELCKSAGGADSEQF